MKKTLCLLLAVLFTLLLAPAGLAAEQNSDTLAMWNITVAVPSDAVSAVLKGGNYYIYAKKDGVIPYVMLTTYKYDSEELFLEDFTEYMQGQYPDLKVTSAASRRTVGGKECYEIVYGYSISGYQARDRRLVLTVNGRTYVFCSKEIPSRGDTVGDMLDRVVADCVFLDADGKPLARPEDEPETADALAYLYRLENGTPKYWLDLSGVMADDPVLHCYFRSSDPTFYERCFILALEDADEEEDTVLFHTVTDTQGNDCSAWFKELRLTETSGSVTMTVRRNERTLAGGAEDNILTGNYVMEPVGVGYVYEYRQEDGLRKYWLDEYDEQLELHAMFRSGEPEYHEEVFLLDTESAVPEGGDVVRIQTITRADGEDVSRWFKSFRLSLVGNAIRMTVQRDERTLAGGADDNILTGSYLLEPRTYLLPLTEGPYTPEELCRWSQIYYFLRSGFYPPEADAEENPDGSFTVHLYEIVSLDGVEHTATSAWYTLDLYGVGNEDITGEPVFLYR